jgi:hypothetical protein
LSQHTTRHNVSETTRFHLQVSNTNVTDKTHFNIISFKGSLREQHQRCTRTALWSLRLRLYGIDGRMTSDCLILKLFEEHSRGLIGYCPRIYWERMRKTVRHVRALAKIRTGHLPNANLPHYFSDIIDTWYGPFKKAVSSSAWVALNEIG